MVHKNISQKYYLTVYLTISKGTSIIFLNMLIFIYIEHNYSSGGFHGEEKS